MKQLPLSRGLFATVDDEDFDFLSQWKWSALEVKRANRPSLFYAVRVTRKGEVEGKPQMVLMHRVIAGAPKGKVVDHRDGDGLHNWRENLRVCTQAENILNAQPHVDARGSRHKGVCWHKQSRKWVAEFRGKYLGCFGDEGAAAAAYDRAATEHNAEFALTNRQLEEA